MCSSVAFALEFGVWKVNTKAPVLMAVWSAARGAGRLSKRGHSFWLRSLAGPIQPPTPLQHPLSARFPHQVKGGGGLHACLSLSPLAFCHQTEPEPPRSASSDRTSRSVHNLAAGSIKPDLLNVLQIQLINAYHSQSRLYFEL